MKLFKSKSPKPKSEPAPNPPFAVEVNTNGVTISAAAAHLEHFEGSYSWGLVPKGVALFRFVMENDGLHDEENLERIFREASIFGLTQDDFDLIFGVDCVQGLRSLQALYRLACNCPDPAPLVELSRVSRMNTDELKQYVERILSN